MIIQNSVSTFVYQWIAWNVSACRWTLLSLFKLLENNSRELFDKNSFPHTFLADDGMMLENARARSVALRAILQDKPPLGVREHNSTREHCD